MEAAVLSPAILWRFLHNSSDSLFQRLNKTSASKTLVVTEGYLAWMEIKPH